MFEQFLSMICQINLISSKFTMKLNWMLYKFKSVEFKLNNFSVA